jgi:hypothetical protein
LGTDAPSAASASAVSVQRFSTRRRQDREPSRRCRCCGGSRPSANELLPLV